jgi:hypothetical protein
MTKPRPLRQRERKLIALYCQCRLAMSPQEFYAKWDVTYETIAEICTRSDSTVRRWFKQGKNHRHPAPADLHHLALMDFLLEYFEEIPEKLRVLLCPQSPK